MDKLEARVRRAEFEKDEFDPRDLIERVTKTVGLQLTQKKTAPTVSGGVSTFDPSEYRDAFEHMLDLIKGLRDEVESELEDTSRLAEAKERTLKQEVGLFQTDLSRVMRNFRALDTSISKVSQTAVHIGDRLQTIEREKMSVVQTNKVMQHFILFNKGKSELIDPIFSADSGKELWMAADLIIELRRVSSEMASRDVVAAQELIAAVYSKIRGSLKEELLRAFRHRDVDCMRQCVERMERMHSEEEWKQVMDKVVLNEYIHGKINYEKVVPNLGSLPGTKSAMEMMKSDITLCLQSAFGSIVKVFGEPLAIMRELIEKVMREHMAPFVSAALSPLQPGKESGPEECWDYLESMRSLHLSVVDMLREISSEVEKSAMTVSRMNQSMESPTVDWVVSEDSVIDTLFSQQLSGGLDSNYFREERRWLKDSLQESITTLLIRVLNLEEEDSDGSDIEQTKEEDRSAENTGMMGMLSRRTKQVISKSTTSSKRTMKKMTSRVVLFAKDADRLHKQMVRLRDVLDTGLPELILQLVKRSEESILRCAEISSGFGGTDTTGERVSCLFDELLSALDEVIVRNMIPPLRASLPLLQPKTEPMDMLFLESIKAMNGSIQLVNQRLFQPILKEDILAGPEMSKHLQRCIRGKNERMAVFERHLQAGLTQMLTACVNWLSKVLSGQRKTDYRPKDDMVADMNETETCLKVCSFVSSLTQTLLRCLDGQNVDRALLFVGARFYSEVVHHLKRMQVSPVVGSMIVNLDVKRYQSTADEMRVPKVSELFLTLIERVQLLGMPAESLRECIDTDTQIRSDLVALKEWLKLRSDYKTIVRPLLREFS